MLGYAKKNADVQIVSRKFFSTVKCLKNLQQVWSRSGINYFRPIMTTADALLGSLFTELVYCKHLSQSAFIRQLKYMIYFSEVSRAQERKIFLNETRVRFKADRRKITFEWLRSTKGWTFIALNWNFMFPAPSRHIKLNKNDK